MISGIVSKIMSLGIDRYSEEYGCTDADVQIQILSNGMGGVTYKMCKNWQPHEEVTFLQIMGKKFDLLGYEALSTPFMVKSLDKFSKDHETSALNISVFMAKRNERIALAIFDGRKNVRSLSLEKHLEEMGM
jgi:hypothetical protein